MRLSFRTWATTALFIALAASEPVGASAELQARTDRAWQAYVERAEREFLTRPSSPAPDARDRGDALRAEPANEDGIIKVPGGLVHHWRGVAFVSKRTIQDVLAVSRAYADYPTIYHAVIASHIIDDDGDTARVQVRLKESAGGLSAVLQVESTVRYVRQGPGLIDLVSRSDEIREVKHAGQEGEYLLPAGRDSGYLWRAMTFSRLVAVPEGVRIEMETLGLSRGFPPLLGWIIEPIARRLGRRSIETTLREFVDATLERSPVRAGP